MYSEDGRTMAGRAEMAIIGAAAGLTMWALGEKAPDIITNPHAYLALVAFGAGFFAVLLGLSGPHKVARAAAPAFVLALVGAVLLTLSGLRFDTVRDLTDAGHPIVAWLLFLFIGTPFAAVRMVQKESLLDYGRLFDTAWSIMVRYSAGWLFAGVLFAVAFLSHALLEIVGITVIEELLRNDMLRWAFLGFALGLGLSVVHELRQYLSPYLLLRMLRMLVPVVLVVVAIFAAAALLQGPNQLFGSLSRAATLLSVAIVMISLISIALDRGEADAIDAPWMRLCTAALALLLPVIAGLAAYAIWLRVAQYGLTPPRMMAAAVALIVALYAVTYPLAVLRGTGWMARVRAANVWIALAAMAVAAFWMTPVIDAEKISTNTQVVRAETGASQPEQVPFWEMYHEWGRAGRAGLDLLAGSKNEGLVQMASRQLAGQEEPAADRRDRQIAELLKVLIVLPEGQVVTAENLRDLGNWELDQFAGCGAEANKSCVWVFGEFDPAFEGQQAMIYRPTSTTGTWRGFLGRERRGAFGLELLRGDVSTLNRTQIDRLIAGDYRIAPASLKSLYVGDAEVLPID